MPAQAVRNARQLAEEQTAEHRLRTAANRGQEMLRENGTAAADELRNLLETDEGRDIYDTRLVFRELAGMRTFVNRMAAMTEARISARLKGHATGTDGTYQRIARSIIEQQEHYLEQFLLNYQRFDNVISDAIRDAQDSLSVQVGFAAQLVTHATEAIEQGHAYFPRDLVAESVKGIRTALSDLQKRLGKEERRDRRASRQARRGRYVRASSGRGASRTFWRIRTLRDLQKVRGSEHSSYYALVHALSDELTSHRIRSDFFVLLHHYIRDFERIDDEIAAYVRDLERFHRFGADLVETAEKAMIPTLEVFRNEPALRHSGYYQEFERLRNDRREFALEERTESRSDAEIVTMIDYCRARLPGLVRAVQGTVSAAASADRRAQRSTLSAERLVGRAARRR